MRNKLVIACVLLGLFSCSEQPTSPPEYHWLIENVHVVDLENGKIDSSRYVEIRNDIILDIYDNSPVNDSIPRIDAKGGFLIPGLWDMHTHYHWNYEYSSQMLIANGVTGIREMWGDLSTIEKIRKRSQSQSIAAPDIFTAGALIDGTPPIWRGSAVAEDAEEAREEVEEQYKDGADFIKVYSRLSPEAYYAIAESASRHGIPFAGHVPYQVSIWDAAAAGQQTIEHLYGVLEATAVPGQRLDEEHGSSFNPENISYNLEHFSEDRLDSLAGFLKDHGTVISPTLVVLRNIAYQDQPALKQDARLEFMPKSIHETWMPASGFPYQDREGFYPLQKQKVQKEMEVVKTLHDAGVLIVAGTDFPNPFCYPGFSLHDELELYVEAGLTPLEALRTATVNPAILMKKEGEYGSVVPGKRANLVILNKNPIEDIRNTREIESVFIRGRYMNREALDSLLEESKAYSKDTF